MEVKQVNSLQRIITGYAAVIGNVDLGNDVIDPGAFAKTLQKKQPSDIDVYIGHDMSRLPVGIPVVLRVDGKGLYSETLVKPGPVGDDLLLTAKFMADHGRPLGQSIGYRVAAGGAKMGRVNGKVVRHLMEIDLHEYSFASGKAVMNPEALTTGVKTGDGMRYSVEKAGDKWSVMKDGKAIGNPFDDEDTAKERAKALNSDDTGKTLPNMLPDSAFLYVQPGGQLDDEGKTVPRTFRHFAYRDADGELDHEALETAVKAIPSATVSGLYADAQTRLYAQARAYLEGHKTALPSVSLDMLAVAYRLTDAAMQVDTEHKALAVIGESTNDGRRMRPETRELVSEASASLGRIVQRAEMVERGEEGKALTDWWAAQFDLLEVAS